ncbi:NAD-dependent epimerase/dehydratase family protein [Patescibacteria group bacterium]|nr:MAG: NAD-dependent epimerase/dehydratase family protein [Patescibacteria group bacterium]
MPTNPTFEKKNILVTGGAGFIGSHLCERLLKDGNRVVCIDNFATSSVRNIDNLLPNPDFQFLRLDVNQPFDLETYAELSAFKLPFQGIQEVYHLACPTSIKQFDKFRIDTLRCNGVGNEHALELARKYKAKVLLTGSSVVYGTRRGDRIFVEEGDTGTIDQLSPRACYDEGRRFSETMFSTYRAVYGLDTRIARVFRTFGPRMPLNDGHLIPDFIMSALEGKDLVVYGKGQFRTSFAYVLDVVDGLVRLMNAPKDPGPVNIGSDVDMPIMQVAEMVVKMTRSASKITLGEDLLFLSELPLPRINKARELGWLPLMRFEDGLSKTVEYMTANRLLLSAM